MSRSALAIVLSALSSYIKFGSKKYAPLVQTFLLTLSDIQIIFLLILFIVHLLDNLV